MDSKKRFLLRGNTVRAFSPQPARKPPIEYPVAFSPSEPALAALLNSSAELRQVFGSVVRPSIQPIGRRQPTVVLTLREDMEREFGRQGFPRVRYTEAASAAYGIGTGRDMDTYITMDRPIGHDPDLIRRLNVEALGLLYGLPGDASSVRYGDQSRFAGWRLRDSAMLSRFQETVLLEGVRDGIFAQTTEFNWRSAISQVSNPMQFAACACVAYACGEDSLRYRNRTHAELAALFLGSTAMTDWAMRINETREQLQQYLSELRLRGYVGTVRCGR